MEVDYNNINCELQQLKDLQVKMTERLDLLQSYLSSVAKVNGCLNADNGCISIEDMQFSNEDKKFLAQCKAEQQSMDKLMAQLENDEEAADRQWTQKVYDAICPDASKPLTEDELKNFGFGVSAEDYAKYIDDMTKMQEANQP